MRGHAGEDGDATRRVGADRRPLEGAHARQLDIAGDAQAEQAALPAGAQAFLGEAFVVRHLEGAAEHGRVIAAVADDVA